MAGRQGAFNSGSSGPLPKATTNNGNHAMPKSLDYYTSLTRGGDVTVSLREDEACIALKVYDYGIDDLNDEERQALYRLIGKLKDQIWP